MVKKRSIGKKGLQIPVLSKGGHTFIWEPTPDAKAGGEILRYLLEQGVETFDVTYARERQAYRKSIASAGLEGKLDPIIWHMEHRHPNDSKDDVIKSFRFELEELGCKKARLAIFEGSENTPDWFYDAITQLKNDGRAITELSADRSQSPTDGF
jgi:predicted aldo/keto reductase-like oxidoreductase